MCPVFAYCRVSDSDQTTGNQTSEIESAGFNVDPERMVIETISGTVAASERPEFAKLLRTLQAGDVLIVTKLDGLGRSAKEVQATVERLADMDVRLHCLALNGVDLTSDAGKRTMGVIAAVADFERDLLIERTKAGMARAREEGKHLGRPSALNGEQQAEVLQRLAAGEAITRIARKLKISRTTIVRIREKAAA